MMNIPEKFPPSAKPEAMSRLLGPMRETKRYLDGKVLVVETGRDYPWKAQLEQRKGKFLELAGPTSHFRRDIVDFSRYRENTLCTNLDKRPGVDEVADATGTQFADGQFRAVFISSFRITDEKRQRPKPEDKIDLENAEYVARVAQEAWRVLAPGGILVWLRLETEAELRSVESLGFVPVFCQDCYFAKNGPADHGHHRYQMVYVKPEKSRSV